MAKGINKVILLGGVCKDPVLKNLSNGAAFTNVTIATTDIWRDKQNERREHTEYHNVVCYGKLAEIASEYALKGSKVYVEGQLRTVYFEKDGNTCSRSEVVAEVFHIIVSSKYQTSSEEVK